DSADRFVRFENDFELRLAVSGSMNHLAYARKLAKTREVTIQRADFEMKYRFIAQTSLECSRRIALQHAASVDDRDAVAKVVGLGHVVRGQQHGSIRLCRNPAADEVAHVAAG